MPARRPIRSSAWLIAFLARASPRRPASAISRARPVVSSSSCSRGTSRVTMPHATEADVVDPGAGVGKEPVLARHDEVAGPRQGQSAGQAGAVDLGDGRLGQVAPAPAHVQVNLVLAGVPPLGA